MESLGALLITKNFDEPTEITALKSYIFATYESLCGVSQGKGMIIVTVASASLANMIRYNQVFIKKHCGIEGKLLIRIGSFN